MNFMKAGLGLGALMAFGAAEAASAKPNVILINVDDLGCTDLACFGSKYYETPNIDRLCSEGMKFTNAYASCAVCSPTRASMLTGRYPSRIGITDWIRAHFQGGRIKDNKNPVGYTAHGELLCPKNHMFMEAEDVTIAELLKPLGYKSCHIGKWHLGPGPHFDPIGQGFDYNYGGCDYGQPPSFYDPYENRKCKGIPGLPSRKPGEYLTDREADEAINFIRKHKDEPFFLNLCHYAVHTPIQPKKSLLKKYKDKARTNHKNAAYATMVESVDQSCGAIMKVLDELKLTENTMIIFTSDNGGLLGVTDNKPFRQGKGHPYEGGIRVPQIVHWPGVVKAGAECDTPVMSIDIFPTIAAAAKAKLPKREIDGESMMPLLTQKGKLKREAIMWHFPHYRGRGIQPYSIIRLGKWKLLKRYAGRKYELYNLEDDISEKNDLSEKMPEMVAKLDKKLAVLLKETNSKLPKPNPNHKR